MNGRACKLERVHVGFSMVHVVRIEKGHADALPSGATCGSCVLGAWVPRFRFYILPCIRYCSLPYSTVQDALHRQIGNGHV